MILIFSASWDTHAKEVYKAIKNKNIDCEIFLTDEYSNSSYISYKDNKTGIVTNNKFINISEISSLLARNPFDWILNSDQTKTDRAFLENELRRCEVNDITKAFINECRRLGIFVINNFDNPIEFKLSNFLRAHELGFMLPKTVIANGKKDYEFLKNNTTEFVIKPFVSRTWYKNKTISKRLKLISGVDLYKKLSNVNVTYPLQIQERIDKQLDLRITVVGKKIYTCAIYSQENPLTTLDSGGTMFENVRHKKYKLPKKIEDLCFELCKRNNLNHGAIDMALDKKGNYIFFEINPYGEYLWIEEKTGLKITDGMAELLIDPEKNKLV